ncbi:nitroreductase family protein, partial [Candidatus Hodarchaeum mangrovi]
MRGKLGTYGFIQGAHTFLIGIMTQMDFDHEHLGYTFENLILYSTYIGLGSCWLGGTFHRASFASIIHLLEDETIPAIAPI